MRLKKNTISAKNIVKIYPIQGSEEISLTVVAGLPILFKGQVINFNLKNK